MSNPFKLKSGNSPAFKKMGASPAKHMKDGSWKGHEHTSWLGKLTNPESEERVKLDKDAEAGRTRREDYKKNKKPGESQYQYNVRMSSEKSRKDEDARRAAKTAETTEDVSEKEDTRKHKIKITQQEGYLPSEDWKKVEENVGGKEEMDALLEKQKTLDKSSQEWKDNQNIINKAYGDKKRH